MSPSSLPSKPAVLVVIIGETVLQDRMLKRLQDFLFRPNKNQCS